MTRAVMRRNADESRLGRHFHRADERAKTARGLRWLAAMKHSLRLCVLAIATLLSACAAPNDDESTAYESSAVVDGFDRALEDQDLVRLNAHRRTVGKAALRYERCLHNMARVLARKNALAGTRAHTPDLLGTVSASCPALRLKANGVGENVGYNVSEPEMFAALLASPPHRKNIEGAFDSVGIGIYVRADGRLFIAQVFADFR